jgi:hypothetical protein
VTTRDDAPPEAPEGRSLQVAEDMRFQRRTWAVERVAWALMALLVLAAAAGLLATGPLSTAEASDEAGLVRVRYERFARLGAPSTLRVELAPGATSSSSSTVALELGRSLTEAIQVERVQPEPLRERAGGDGGLVLEFGVAEPGRPALVRIFAKREEIGLVEGEVGLAGRPRVRFTQFVYP